MGKQPSVVQQVVDAFTSGSEKMHAMMGYPGVLLLLSVIVIALHAMPGYDVDFQLSVVIATASLLGSAVTYSIDRLQQIRREDAQRRFFEQYTLVFLEKYLAGKDNVGPEEIEWSINHIVKELTKKQTLGA